jgi:hypothetical protein
MELSIILQVVLPFAGLGVLVMGGASSRLARTFRIRRRPFRWDRGYTAVTPRVVLVRGELPRVKRSSLPGVVGRFAVDASRSFRGHEVAH